LDAHSLPNLRKAKCLTWLRNLQVANLAQQLTMRIDRRGIAGIEYRELALEMGLERQALQRLAKPMIDGGELSEVSDDLLIARELVHWIAGAIVALLQADNQHSGLKRSEIKSQLGLGTAVFDFVIRRLVADGRLTILGEIVFEQNQNDTQQIAQSTPWSAVAEAFRLAGLATPLVAEVAARLNLSEAEIRRQMTLLLREGLLVKMGNNEIYIHRDALQVLRSQLADLRGRTLEVSSFKEMTRLSRKYAIPLLEYLDRERVTRKVGDRRLVL
jgi:selenocysteine-specific elongation factor